MTMKRITSPAGTTFAHLICRVVDKNFVFAPVEERRIVRDLLFRAARFSGVEIITFVILYDHFHVQAGIPQRPEDIPTEEVLRRIKCLYEGKALLTILDEWERIEQEEGQEGLEHYADRFRARMYDMGEFMKTFKQRVTMRYNIRHDRDGTLWGERYKSILIQGDPTCLAMRIIAAYIDLNPVRAGLVDDPAAYEFSGLGEAMAGNEEAQRSLMKIFPQEAGGGNWEEFLVQYGSLLYLSEEKKRGPLAAKRLQAAMKGRFTLPEILRRRIRHFSAGLVLGNRDFVNAVFRANRDHFGPRRKDGARPIPRCPDWRGQLYAARDLRKDVLGPMTG